MSFDLHVGTQRWRTHLDVVATRSPGLVPVVKGNGYGFGAGELLSEAARMSADLVAVGTVADLDAVAALPAAAYAGELLVLVPFHDFDPPVPPSLAARVVRTLGRVAEVDALLEGSHEASCPVVLEIATSMRRHGIELAELGELAAALASAGDRLDVRGAAVHLPLPGHADPAAEVDATLAALRTHGLPSSALFVSHLTIAQTAELARTHPGTRIRLRTGTALWLADRDAYRATATVLDVRPIRRGDTYGYRARRAWWTGHLLTVSGGTANGVATEPPAHAGSLRNRANALAAGALDAGGRALSPFYVAGRRRWFAEPPHMQVSMLALPGRVAPPVSGDEVGVNVGMTLTRFDRVVWE